LLRLLGSAIVTAEAGPAPSGQWTAEVAVTPEFAAELIREQFPDLAGQQVRVLETGWDNTAFAVGSEWLFRFPRREVAVPGVRREMAVLPRLAARLPLPIPDPRFAGQPSGGYPWPFFGTRLLPGGELADSGLTDAQRTRAAAGVGEFLRALHDPGLVALVADDGLPVDPMGRASPPVRARRARPVLDRLVNGGIWMPDGDVLRLLGQATQAAEEPQPGELVVSHGDLHVRHLLVGEDGAATGVIDWGDLCLADPAADLSIAYLAFAGEARAELLAAYGGPVGAGRELAARTCAVSLAASLLEYAADDGRTVLREECLAGLRRVVAP
jgi:aminoglycoside phosphotransferase (APT) family kinase protein